ncbi:McrC family protein [Paracoccaceae bacterium]|nr:McrC family protein [Paracoccaceae bacterium]
MKDQKVYKCTEREVLEIPLSEVLHADGKLKINPEVQSKGFFDIDFRRGSLSIISGKYIGRIPLNSEIVIDVRPKIPVSNLVHILGTAEHKIGSLDFFDRPYEKASYESDNVLEFIIRTLLHELNELVINGPIRKYRQIEHRGGFRPKINFSKTLKNHWSRGNYITTSCEPFIFSFDTPENRLLRFTVWNCVNNQKIRSALPKNLVNELTVFDEMLSSIPLDRQLSFLNNVRHALRVKTIPSIRAYYYKILTTCLLLLHNEKIDFEGEAGEVHLSSFIINLEDVFESYIRAVIKKHFSNHPLNIAVHDGNHSGRRYLFHDAKSYDIKPDIFLTKGGKVQAVLDAKYKVKSKENDRYQIITHSTALGSKSSILVLPKSESGLVGMHRRGQVFDSNGLTLYEYFFDLSGSIDSAETDFCSNIDSLVA